MPQGRFLAYADAMERLTRRMALESAAYAGMAMAGGDQRTWDEIFESTLTEEEREARYARGWEEIGEADRSKRRRRR